MGKKIVIDAPKHPVIRYKFDDERHVTLDLRGIRNPHSPFNGMMNPSKGYKRRFVSPEHLQCMVNEYFESCNGPLIDRDGRLVYDRDGHLVKTQVKAYTVSGLALYLGVSTQTLRQYRNGQLDTLLDEMRAQTDDTLTFSRVILRAKQTIEAYAENRLYDRDGSNGARFVLDCQFGWVDHKTAAEIEKAKTDSKIKCEDFELKKRLVDTSTEDENFTINIVRGKRKE